jgi:3-methyladenine DNA glycosylase/8-oxoguanine DNA glycosylase
MRSIELDETESFFFEPRAPYNFDANFHKPSHFPSSDNAWESGTYWITMVWRGKFLGLRFENKGNADYPRIKLTVYSRRSLPDTYLESLRKEIGCRFNFDQDISDFCRKYRTDEFLGQPIRHWRGMKPVAANSLYETLMIYVVLQNATVKRSVQMLENLFTKFGKRESFDRQTLSTFWTPTSIAESTEEELRALKVGYRAKFLMRISEQFAEGIVAEFALRKMPKEHVRRQLDRLYGIGAASVEYLLFEDFYFLDALETIPPWEQKIMSRFLFRKSLVPADRVLHFFRKRCSGYEKLAFHYIWEDLFWRRKKEHIEWLEKEIRL